MQRHQQDLFILDLFTHSTFGKNHLSNETIQCCFFILFLYLWNYIWLFYQKLKKISTFIFEMLNDSSSGCCRATMMKWWNDTNNCWPTSSQQWPGTTPRSPSTPSWTISQHLSRLEYNISLSLKDTCAIFFMWWCMLFMQSLWEMFFWTSNLVKDSPKRFNAQFDS